MNVAQFRADFPEFADTVKYPDGSVNFWLTFMGKLLNAARWADLLDMGLELATAHHLIINAKNQKSAGGILAPISSKSVDTVSVSFDTKAVTLENAGHWATTNYGQRFWQLLMMAGAGGVQL